MSGEDGRRFGLQFDTLEVLKEQGDFPVVVGMSGGVDSSVTASLLTRAGIPVIGMFMKNWDDATGAPGSVSPAKAGVGCTAVEDYEDGARVADQIGIPYYSVEFVKEYWDHVFQQFLADYQKGLTPNPDILCNREIKFQVFLKHALEMGGKRLATGHYCRAATDVETGERVLLKGVDPNKDQTYFVYTLGQEALSSVLFPIGDLPKSRVRELALEAGLATAKKKDSTGICFIGERDFKEFLSRYLKKNPGPFKRLSGEVVGEHHGVAFYTLGQRRGMGLGGEGDSWYVVAKDPQKNIVYVERGGEHPALFADELWIDELSWVSGSLPSDLKTGSPWRAWSKARYRQPDQLCTVVPAEGGLLKVTYDQPQRALTPGQSVVFYRGESGDLGQTGGRCVGGGRIVRVGPSYFDRKLSLK